MAYEIFKKVVTEIPNKKKQKPLMVAMDKYGRLRINQGFYYTMVEEGFTKVMILIDYEHSKIALKMLKDKDIAHIDYDPKRAKTLTRGDRTHVAFVSFVTVKNSLNLQFPFIRNATWDAKENLIEFSWKEDI